MCAAPPRPAPPATVLPGLPHGPVQWQTACEVQLHPRAAPLVPSVACSTLHLPDPVAVVLVTAAAPIAIGAAGGMGLGVGNAANGVNAVVVSSSHVDTDPVDSDPTDCKVPGFDN